MAKASPHIGWYGLNSQNSTLVLEFSMSRKAKTVSASEVLNRLGSSAPSSPLAALSKVASKVVTDSKPNKWELPLTSEARIEAERWISSRVVLDPVQARCDNAKAALNQYALSVMADMIYSTKNKPTNPVVTLKKSDGTVDHQFLWLMTDKFKLELPTVPTDADARKTYIAAFVCAGIHPHDATALVDNELDLSPQIDIRSPKELTTGRYGEGRQWIEASEAEKVVGQKLIALVLWNGKGTPPCLTEQEQSMIVVQRDSVKVKAGFYARVATYCRSPEQVMAIFSLIQPVVYPAHHKFALSDTVTEQAERRIQAAAEIIGADYVS